MEGKRYIARKRARFKGCNGRQVNIPYGSTLEERDGFLLWNGEPVCVDASQNAYDYFSRDDDGQGQERGALVGAIISRLEKRDKDHQARWNKIWPDAICQKYKRSEHKDFGLWNHDFFNAPVEDLRHIAVLVGAMV